MKKFKKILLFSAFAFCITMAGGCEDAPEPVREEVTEGQADKEPEQFVSVKEAAEQVSQLEGKTVNGIVFPEKIVMPDTEEVQALEMTSWYEDHKDISVLEETVKNMWAGYEGTDWSKAKEKQYVSPVWNEYFWTMETDEQTGYRYSFGSHGFFSADAFYADYPDGDDTPRSIIAGYDFEWGDPELQADDAYELEDGEVTVRDAVAYTESLFKDNLPGLEKDLFDYKVRQMYVMKHDGEENCYFKMLIGRCYRNMDVCTAGSFQDENGDEYNINVEGDCMEAIMFRKNALDYINVGTELYNPKPLEASRKIISPLWAARLIDKEIAHSGGMELTRCGLFYLRTEERKPEDYEKKQFFETSYMRPMWIFSQAPVVSASDEAENPNMNNLGASVIIDALDGTLYYYGHGSSRSHAIW